MRVKSRANSTFSRRLKSPTTHLLPASPVASRAPVDAPPSCRAPDAAAAALGELEAQAALGDSRLRLPPRRSGRAPPRQSAAPLRGAPSRCRGRRAVSPPLANAASKERRASPRSGAVPRRSPQAARTIARRERATHSEALKPWNSACGHTGAPTRKDRDDSGRNPNSEPSPDCAASVTVPIFSSIGRFRFHRIISPPQLGSCGMSYNVSPRLSPLPAARQGSFRACSYLPRPVLGASATNSTRHARGVTRQCPLSAQPQGSWIGSRRGFGLRQSATRKSR